MYVNVHVFQEINRLISRIKGSGDLRATVYQTKLSTCIKELKNSLDQGIVDL